MLPANELRQLLVEQQEQVKVEPPESVNFDPPMFLLDPPKKIKFDFKKDFFVLSTPHKIFNSFIKRIPKKNLFDVWND